MEFLNYSATIARNLGSSPNMRRRYCVLCEAESGWRLSARTPLSAVADSKGGNASTGAS